MPTERDTTKFEHANPILNVEDMSASVAYFVDVLGFENADWGTDEFTCVTRNGAAIYLCQSGQGGRCTWVWVGVADVAALFEEYKSSGAIVAQEPQNYPWAYEMRVEDPNGHVLRLGSGPRTDMPIVKDSG